MSQPRAEVEARLERERAFHERAWGPGWEETGARAGSEKFYAISQGCKNHYNGLLAPRAAGADALEYGCGPGSRAFFLARGGARVTGIDLSPTAIALASESDERRGVEDRTDFRVMNAEELEFPDDSFDLITGAGILHHLDLERSFSELARVMRPDGVGIFSEPMGHNPFVNAYRRATPEARTPDEHPLLMSDFALARRHFGQVRTRFFHLTSIPAFALRRAPGFERLVAALEALDRVIFTVLPPLRRYAWFVVLELAEPRR